MKGFLRPGPKARRSWVIMRGSETRDVCVFERTAKGPNENVPWRLSLVGPGFLRACCMSAWSFDYAARRRCQLRVS